MGQLIDWSSKGLTLLLLLLAALFVLWQCFEGLAKVTTIGAEFRHFIVNRRNFDRWLKEMTEREARERADSDAFLARLKCESCDGSGPCPACQPK